jgi:hypothetical protein
MSGWQPRAGSPAPANPPSGGSAVKSAPSKDFSIAKLSLAPGDILVVKVHQRIAQETFNRISDYFSQQAPGHRVLILDRDLDLSVLTKADVEKLA